MNEMLSAWAGILIVMGAAILVTLVAMVWILFFRNKPRRRHRRRRQPYERHQPHPTLAQSGGLPPPRPEGKPAERQPPTLMPKS